MAIASAVAGDLVKGVEDRIDKMACALKREHDLALCELSGDWRL
jgi:hypothetical protein